jgi:hypothetical protein
MKQWLTSLQSSSFETRIVRGVDRTTTLAIPDRTFDATSADYWRARERAERAAAKQARSPLARAVHQELAQEYAARVRGLEGPTPSSRQR